MKASEVFDGADDAQQEKWEQELAAKHPEAAGHIADSKQLMSGWTKEDGSLIKKELAELTMKAENEINLKGDDASKMQKILDILEDLDDVQEVYTNAE